MFALLLQQGGIMSEQNSRVYLTDYSPDDSKWDFHKSATEKIEFFYSSSDKHKNYGARMSTCSELLRFMYVDDLDTAESKLKLSSAQFCRVRLCPVCQWRRSMAWRAKLFQKLPLLLADKPNLRFIFLTLTVKNCDISELSQVLKDMNEAFSRLRKLKMFTRAVKGFIRSTEVTKSNTGKAHPHFHCILAVNKSYFTDKSYIKTDKWAEMWQECLRVDYVPVVDCRKIRQKGNEIETKAVLETLKYTTKIEHLLSDKDWFLELTDQLFKKRFIATGGCFKDVLKEDVSNQEMISNNLDEETKNEELKNSLFFGWETSSKKYRKVKNPHL